MKQFIATGRIANNGTGSAVVNHNLAPLLWIIRQGSIDLNPQQPGAICQLYMNGVLLSPTASGSLASAGGLPSIKLFASDSLTASWQGAAPNSQGVFTVYYDEYVINETPPSIGVF